MLQILDLYLYISESVRLPQRQAISSTPPPIVNCKMLIIHNFLILHSVKIFNNKCQIIDIK